MAKIIASANARQRRMAGILWVVGEGEGRFEEVREGD